jgi:site-specific DNA-methyltransferase (adenine-specific)
MSLWLAECWRLARPNGALMLFSDWRQLPLFSDALQAAGWVWRSTVVWDKGERTRPNKGFFRHQAEYVLFATKGAWEAPTTNCLPGVLSFPVEPARKNHLTAKPVGLIVRLMEVLAPGAVVLDPFMGGGAVPRACVLTGRECVGIELEPESYQSAERLVVGGCLF